MLVHILTSALSEVNTVRHKHLRQSDDPQERVRNDDGSPNNPTEQDEDTGFPLHGPNKNNQEEPDTHHPVVHVIYRDRNPRLPDPPRRELLELPDLPRRNYQNP